MRLVLYSLYSLICASRSFFLIEVENPANEIRATLACLLTCVYSACVLDLLVVRREIL